jgi:MoaA/NifB/PqqE/SkfB family radical SAM enzyme
MIKKVRTPDYNYDFDTCNGHFSRWGNTYKDDPQMSPIGPEIADIEISTICHGIGGVPCKHCYKSNTGNGKNMNLETFKKVFSKLPKNVGQIAFGIGDIDGNPDMLEIFKYCRNHGVVPNVTINGDGLTKIWASSLAQYCGAVAVSRYDDKNVCYNAIAKLSDAGLKQVNIHQLVSEETFENCMETVIDIVAGADNRLKRLKAIVFLSLKQKGRGASFHKLSQKKYDCLMRTCLENGISFGMDSCSASKFLDFLNRYPKYDVKNIIKKYVEPCESTLFSIYVNVNGTVYPCSFCEGHRSGNNLNNPAIDFLQDIWYDGCKGFRKELIANDRRCPEFNV